MGGLLHLVQRGGDWAGRGPGLSSLTTHPSTASVPMTILLYNGPLLCGFNVPIKGLVVTNYVPQYSIDQQRHTCIDKTYNQAS